MSIETGIIALAEAVGTDVKSLTSKIGDLTQLTMTEKINLVVAINEVAADVQRIATINDTAGLGDTGDLWSADKTVKAIQTAIDNLVGGAPDALNTLVELAEALGNDENLAQNMITQINNRVRFDELQVLTTEQQLTACTNIGVGNPMRDFKADYNGAKS